MASLPFFLQPLLTWVTGKPLKGEVPWWPSSPAWQLGTGLLSLGGGVAVGMLAYQAGGWGLMAMLPAALFVIGGARKMQVMLIHQCSHYQFTGNRGWDRGLAEAMSILILTDHFDSYYQDHIYIHHTKKLASEVDPDCKFLLELGFAPGMSKSELKRHLLWTALSPEFHAKFLSARLRSNFVAPALWRRLAALGWAALVVVGVTALGQWEAFLLAGVLPLTLGYHVAALLNFASLHLWLKEKVPGESTKARLTGLTVGRFCGAPAPVSASLLDWTKWVWVMLVYHVPVRIAVLVGDLPVHDYHHRYPRCPQWPDHLYTRQWDIDAGTPGWDLPYADAWGLHQAIDTVFEQFSNMPHVPAEAGPVTNIVHI